MIYLSFRTWGIREKIISDQSCTMTRPPRVKKTKSNPNSNTEKKNCWIIKKNFSVSCTPTLHTHTHAHAQDKKTLLFLYARDSLSLSYSESVYTLTTYPHLFSLFFSRCTSLVTFSLHTHARRQREKNGIKERAQKKGIFLFFIT